MCSEKKRMSDHRVNETFNRQGFKADANNILLWLWISAVSRESNSTTELTLMWMYVALYSSLHRDGGTRTAADRMCAVARYYDISSKKQILETFLSSTIKNRHIKHPYPRQKSQTGAPDRKCTLQSDLKGAGLVHMTCTYGFSHFRHFQNCCNRDGNTIFKYMNYVPIIVATDLEVHFSVLKKGVSQ